MTPSEAAAVLVLAAAYDNRTPSETAARAWAEALDENVAYADARTIVIEHYARTREWIMPADVNAASRSVRKARTDRMRTPEPPAELDGDWAAEQEWIRTYARAIGDGLDEQHACERADWSLHVTRALIEPAARPVAALIEQAAKSLPRVPRPTTKEIR